MKKQVAFFSFAFGFLFLLILSYQNCGDTGSELKSIPGSQVGKGEVASADAKKANQRVDQSLLGVKYTRVANFQRLTKDPKSSPVELYYHFADNEPHCRYDQKKVMFLMHGSGGKASGWLEKIETQQFLKEAQNQCWSFIATESVKRTPTSKAASHCTFEKKLEKGQWSTYGARAPSDKTKSEDIKRNCDHQHLLSVKRHFHLGNTPIAMVGISKGGGTVTSFAAIESTMDDPSQKIGIRAVVAYISTGYGAIAGYDETYNVPTALRLMDNDQKLSVKNGTGTWQDQARDSIALLSKKADVDQDIEFKYQEYLKSDSLKEILEIYGFTAMLKIGRKNYQEAGYYSAMAFNCFYQMGLIGPLSFSNKQVNLNVKQMEQVSEQTFLMKEFAITQGQSKYQQATGGCMLPAKSKSRRQTLGQVFKTKRGLEGAIKKRLADINAEHTFTHNFTNETLDFLNRNIKKVPVSLKPIPSTETQLQEIEEFYQSESKPSNTPIYDQYGNTDLNEITTPLPEPKPSNDNGCGNNKCAFKKGKMGNKFCKCRGLQGAAPRRCCK